MTWFSACMLTSFALVTSIGSPGSTPPFGIHRYVKEGTAQTRHGRLGTVALLFVLKP